MGIKYVNEMEDYLYNHNYISQNNNNIKQQELSLERASCIVQKYRTLTEEKDKEIERLNNIIEKQGIKDKPDYYVKGLIGSIKERDKEINRLRIENSAIDTENIRLNNIIDGYENIKKELLDYIYHNEYCRFGHIDGGEADEMREIISKTDKLKALKEGKE